MRGSTMLNPTGAVARFVRERQVSFEESMDSSPVEHLVEFWNWLDNEGLVASPATVHAEVLTVGALRGDQEVLALLEKPEPMALLRTDIDGARILAVAVGTEVELKIRRKP